MRVLAVQFLRYLTVGGVAFVADFSTLYALTEFANLHYLASATIGFLLGLLINYGLSVRWIFPVRTYRARARVEFILFAVVGIVGLALNNLCIFVLAEIVNLHYLHAKLIATSLVLLFNFGLRRRLLFTVEGA